MQREENRNTYLLQEGEDMGVVQIADDVVETIAGLAATEVEGVSTANGNLTAELISKVGAKGIAKGVKVDIFNKRVKVDLALRVGYGYNIPATCQKVQSKVKAAIENMTGLEVAEVNIRIAGVNMQKNK
ncbi:MAG: Asp23/Gls24 family envelope stress response protein [Lachnospiraceae bacterium]|nr:Asp23/Gls24 family envelope stress response protein [Lachnospiraceae bacterium]